MLALLLETNSWGDRPDQAPLPTAQLKVSGLGLLGNRASRNALLELRPDGEAAVFDDTFVEDAFLVLHNRSVDEGYLGAKLSAEATLEDGSTIELSWDGRSPMAVPHEIQATHLHMRVAPGKLHYYEELQIDGVEALSSVETESFFVIRNTLLQLRKGRRYSPNRLKSSVQNLRRGLQRLGYREVEIHADPPEIDPDTGGVRVRLRVVQGPRHLVGTLQLSVTNSPTPVELELPMLLPGQPFSQEWEQDTAQAVRIQLYHQGYPDARVHLIEIGRQAAIPDVELKLVAVAEPGERVTLGDVRWTGATHTRDAFLDRHTRLQGPWLDKVEADRVRERLGRLGHFRFVDLNLEPETGSPRDVVYELTEGKRYDVNLMAGYGSYDQAFGGIEFDHYNLWGVGHNTRLRLIQSFKSTVGAFSYTLPDFLLPDVNVFGAVDGFQREELTFDRQEIKLSVGAHRHLIRSGQQVALRYSYQLLDAQTAASGDTVTHAAAIIGDWQLDRRDHALLPREGYRLHATLEYANPTLGGESDYVRLETGASCHQPLGRGLTAHLGLSYELAAGLGNSSSLPFNKRFFPGGENSVRGYQRGGASPLDAEGNQLGAESVLGWNVELELHITRRISVVGFLDGTGVTPSMDDWPFDEDLWAAGAGVRWNTVIGPVRLEYGHNLTPRPADPQGTLHFSIGFPF